MKYTKIFDDSIQGLSDELLIDVFKSLNASLYIGDWSEQEKELNNRLKEEIERRGYERLPGTCTFVIQKRKD